MISSALYWVLDSLFMFVTGGCMFTLIVITVMMAKAALGGQFSSDSVKDGNIAIPHYEKFAGKDELLASKRNEGALGAYVSENGIVHTYVCTKGFWHPNGQGVEIGHDTGEQA